MRLLLHADASRQWEPAGAITARIARATGSHVTVLTAERVKRKQQEVLRRAEQVLGLPKSQLELRAEGGLVEHVVPKVAAEGRFDLLVLAPLGGLDWLTHGHILSLLVAHAETNALLVRGSGAGFAKALVATEGGPHGAADVEAALALAAIFDMEVHLLHVLSQIAIYDYIKQQPDVAFLESGHAVAEHLRELRTVVAKAGRRGDAKVRVGPVQDEILHEVRDSGCDLLVIGAHRPEKEESLLTRDTSAWLLRHCPVSTLVVRDARWPPPGSR
ncbi:MAG TPA: universal stress protein [Candidatus Thermoplasmatota archaeon]|jgi:nucleotide-binding universal stress UspA family protein|nr:universal stress protein [Candidatus Thermoplasmatota archaeon]